MSMQDLVEALRLISANQSLGFFAGPRDPSLILAAESALGAAFPPIYREFLRQLGAGNFGTFEVYGVTNNNFETAKVPNGVWLTLKQRRAGRIPPDFLVVSATGDGAYYGIELREGLERPVLVLEPGIAVKEQHPEIVAQDFGEFFLDQVREQL